MSAEPGSTSSSEEWHWPSPQDPHPLADALQDVERLVEFFARVGRGHDGTDARLTFGHCGKRDARAHDALFEQLAREIHGQAAVAHDDGRDRRLAGRRVYSADVEAQSTQLLLPVARVVPELLDALGFLLQHVEGRDAGGGDGRRMRRREQEWPSAMVEELDEVARAANVAAQRTDGFRQRADLHVHPAMELEVIDSAAPVAPQHAR